MQATDTRLGREVVIEVLPADAAHLPWLRALARLGGARLQRVLRLERVGDGTTRVVYEALAGRTPRPPSLHAARARSSSRARSRRCTPPASPTARSPRRWCSRITARRCSPQAAVRRGISVEEEVRELAGLVAEHA